MSFSVPSPPPPPPPPPPPILTVVQSGDNSTSNNSLQFSYYTTTPPPLYHSSSSSFSSSFQNLSPSIFIIIIILSITFIASVALCLLLRHLNGRCLLRHHLSSPNSSSNTTSDSTRLSNPRVSPENPNSASSLPIFSFSSITRSSRNCANSADCAVCLSKFEPADQLRLLPLCCHAFHALCIDTWLHANQTCPLCRSAIFPSDSEIFKTLFNENSNTDNNTADSFRLEIGNVSRRQTDSDSGDPRRSYSIGSFDYLVEDEYSEVALSNAHRRNVSDIQKEENIQTGPTPEQNLVAEVSNSTRSWLKDYVDRLSISISSRALSFRSSGRFFSGSSRRSEIVDVGVGDWDLESGRVGEEIGELFRWLSGV